MKSKLKSRTSWREKLEKSQEPKLVTIPAKMSRFGKGFMLIPTPLLVDGLLRRVPKGKLITVGRVREKLARDQGAKVTCPLTTGIFLRIVAEAAEEDRAQGAKRIAPYWRIVRDDGGLNPKFPGGVARQARYLRAEGFAVVRHGKKPPVVKEFERRLFNLT